ncbi:hypothetical protein CHS0354_028918 [Potamilus streckersoni]|uniref:Uncharacterized protein n=1 Tax=Potamilus streckersoni TaxID=2493646 RepID=A0AAE0SJ28_9BIVA|nr:hypothetical protein CHS0354_028918 [Potamilus streckersoni]
MSVPRIDTQTKKQIILKPGGCRSLGGVIISLLKWDTNASNVLSKKKATLRSTQKTNTVMVSRLGHHLKKQNKKKTNKNKKTNKKNEKSATVTRPIQKRRKRK